MWTNSSEIAYAIIFNILMLSFIAGLVLSVASYMLYVNFECHERWKTIYPDDVRYYHEALMPDDKETTISQWKRDRFAYSVWKVCLRCDDMVHNQPMTTLPFNKWIETVNPRKREWWAIYGNQNISPDYPGAHILFNPTMANNFDSRRR